MFVDCFFLRSNTQGAVTACRHTVSLSQPQYSDRPLACVQDMAFDNAACCAELVLLIQFEDLKANPVRKTSPPCPSLAPHPPLSLADCPSNIDRYIL